MRIARVSEMVVAGLFLSSPLARAQRLEIVTIDGAEAVKDEYIVRFRAGVKGAEPTAAASAAGFEVLRAIAPVNAYLVRFKATGKGKAATAIKPLAAEPSVELIEPNYIYRHQQTPTPEPTPPLPDDPKFGDDWGLNNTGQSGGRPDCDIDAPEAWQVRSDASSVVVAVIDSGIDLEHPDLRDNLWTNPGEIAGNGIDDDGDGFVDDVHGWDFSLDKGPSPQDRYRHGTHVAGTIGAVGNNQIGTCGVCPKVRLMACKFLDRFGSGTLEGAINATSYAIDHGARVFNNSWGGTGDSKILKELIEKAAANKVVYVAAAGNSNTNNDKLKFYPASYDVANVIAVAAIDRKEKLADFSSYGPTSVLLGAPGVDILSTLPPNYGSYGQLSGTSMAAPHVSGAVALLLAKVPGLDPVEVKERLKRTVDPAPALVGKTASGGRLNVNNLLRDQPGQPLPPAPPDTSGCGGGGNAAGLALPLGGVLVWSRTRLRRRVALNRAPGWSR